MKNIKLIGACILIVSLYLFLFVKVYNKPSTYDAKQRMSYVKDSLEVEILKYRLNYIKK